MKKLVNGLFVAALALTLGTSAVSAQAAGARKNDSRNLQAAIRPAPAVACRYGWRHDFDYRPTVINNTRTVVMPVVSTATSYSSYSPYVSYPANYSYPYASYNGYSNYSYPYGSYGSSYGYPNYSSVYNPYATVYNAYTGSYNNGYNYGYGYNNGLAYTNGVYYPTYPTNTYASVPTVTQPAATVTIAAPPATQVYVSTPAPAYTPSYGYGVNILIAKKH